MVEYFKEIADILNGFISHSGRDVSDELRREIWHSRAQGKTTEDKIRYILGHFVVAREGADRMHSVLGDINGNVKEPENLEALPEEVVILYIPVECLNCGAKALIVAFITVSGWYTYTNIRCPNCDSPKCIAMVPRIAVDGL